MVARSQIRTFVVRCVASLLLLALLFCTGVAAADVPQCQITTTGIDGLVLFDPTRIEVKAKSGFTMTVIPTLPKGPARAVAEGPALLGLAEASVFEVRLSRSMEPRSSTECRVSFDALWHCAGSPSCNAPPPSILSPAPRVGFAGGVLSQARLTELFSMRGRDDPAAYNLIVAAAAAGGPSRVFSCDPHEARSVTVNSPLQIPLDKKSLPFETADLLLAAPGTSKCFRLATLVRDERTFVIESGDVRQAFPLPQLTGGKPIVVVENSGTQPVCRIELAREIRLMSCDQRIVVHATEGLPQVDLPAPIRYQFRILGDMDGQECPSTPPPQDTPIRAFAPKGRLCIYRKVSGATAFSLVEPTAPNVKRDLNGWLFSVCVGKSDSCATATEIGADIALPSDFSAAPALKIQMDASFGALSPSFVTLGKTSIFRQILSTSKVANIEYVSNNDLENALLGSGALLCLPLTEDQRKEIGPRARFPQDAAPTEYIHVEVGGVAMEVHSGWELQRDGQRFCPARAITPFYTSVSEILERFARREFIEVKYSQQGREIAQRRLQSSTSIDPMKLSVHDAGATPTTVGNTRTDYDPSRSLLDLGKWVCIQLAQDVGKDVQIRLSRLGMSRDLGGSVVGRFSSASGFARFERHKETPSTVAGMSYCTNLISSVGAIGDVRFVAEPGDVPSQGALSFTWDGTALGCRTAAGDHTSCEGLTPRPYYLAYILDATRFSHIDVGTARTSDGRARLRVSGMVPLLDTGVGFPGVVSLAPQLGFSLPITLLADSTNSDVNASNSKTESSKTFAGLGLGAFGAVCIKVQVALGPRLCSGVQVEGNLDVVQRAGRVSGLEFQGLAGYFVSMGVGIR